MSDTSQGAGWWQASDGKWYAPRTASPQTLPSNQSPPFPNSDYRNQQKYERGLDSLMSLHAKGSLTDAQYKVQKDQLFDRYNYPDGRRPPRVMKKSRVPKVLVGILAFFLVVIVLLVGIAIYGASIRQSLSGATILSVAPVDPAEATVVIQVPNTGSRSVTPTCSIHLSSPGGAYSGFDSIKASNPIAPGGVARFSDTITVTNQGASFIDLASSTVSCS